MVDPTPTCLAPSAALRALRALAASERLAAVDGDRRRFGHPALARALLAECRARVRKDPRDASTWAALAETILRREPRASLDLVRAIACRGNAERASGDLPAARTTLAAARRLLHELEEPVEPSRTSAELYSFLGSLESDSHRFDQALAYLETASRLFLDAGLDTGLARVLMKVSNVHTYRGDIGQALRSDYAALVHLDEEAEPRLYVSARFNLACDLVEIGDLTAAVDHLVYDEDVYAAHADQPLLLRRSWLTGRIAAAQGRLDDAERLLCEARDGFVERSVGFDAALTGLDLALLYLQQGRLAEVRAEAEMALRVFAACEVHPEALAALRLLTVASADLREESIRTTIEYLRRAQRQGPALAPNPS